VLNLHRALHPAPVFVYGTRLAQHPGVTSKTKSSKEDQKVQGDCHVSKNERSEVRWSSVGRRSAFCRRRVVGWRRAVGWLNYE